MGLKYSFKREVSKDLTIFKNKLKAKDYKENTIRQNRNYAGIFLTWIHANKLSLESVSYMDVISFIQNLKTKACSGAFINRILLSIRHYYELSEIESNPAGGVYLRGTRVKILNEQISVDSWENIYKSFKQTDDRSKRNLVILGLLIFQGLTTEEINNLTMQHFDLRGAKLRVPKGQRTNARTLDLHAIQTLDLQEYIIAIRCKILTSIALKKSKIKTSTIKEKKIENQLFFSMNGSKNLKSSLHHMFLSLRKDYPQISSARKIRQRVITDWLKTYGLRKVQYMAGHKYVRSTQRYLDYDLSALTNEVKLYHPLA